MSVEDDSDLPDGQEASAAEYVLGLLPEEEVAAFESRLEVDPDLQRDVAAWRDYLATLADPVPDVDPPPQVWRRIESARFGPPRKPLWRQLVPYGVGAVLGAVLAWTVFTLDLLAPAAPELRADLAPVEGVPLALTARFDPQSGVLAVDLAHGAVPDTGALELWLIAEEDAAPVSLGLLDASGRAVRRVPPLLAERMAGATLAVSEEPAGGSPTGAPTGPVRAAGALTET